MNNREKIYEECGLKKAGREKGEQLWIGTEKQWNKADINSDLDEFFNNKDK